MEMIEVMLKSDPDLFEFMKVAAESDPEAVRQVTEILKS